MKFFISYKRKRKRKKSPHLIPKMEMLRASKDWTEVKTTKDETRRGPQHTTLEHAFSSHLISIQS
jgi:hypothetical protein